MLWERSNCCWALLGIATLHTKPGRTLLSLQFAVEPLAYCPFCSQLKQQILFLPQSGKFSSSSPPCQSQPQGLQYAEDAAEHENMKAVLKTCSTGGDSTMALGVRTRSRASRGKPLSFLLETFLVLW